MRWTIMCIELTGTSKRRIKTTAVWPVLFAVVQTIAVAQQQVGLESEIYSTRPELGSAEIVYLDHSGWLIRTKNHLLVFDYVEPAQPAAGRLLAQGFLDPSLFPKTNIVVFITHDHKDHFDPIVFAW